ncbi:MAG: hypothetical protein KC464_16245, partial [Myxococcales bacterium]|nr:hypothetical protein [Myxococcales bacterium]
ALRDAVHEFASDDQAPTIAELFEWLAVLSLDAFATAGTMSAQERAAEQIEAGTPVVLVAPELPAVLLLGAPTTAALDSILGRALLLVVRAGAPALVLDVSGLVDPMAPVVLRAIERFFGQPRMKAVTVVLSGANPQIADAWVSRGAATGVTVTSAETFDAAVARGLERAGYALRKRT